MTITPSGGANASAGDLPPRKRRYVAMFALVLVPILVVGGALFIWLGGVCACGSSAPASPLVGIVTAVESEGLGDVRGFTLRQSDGVAWELVLGDLENETTFSPSHLAEHQATSEPIRAFFRVEARGLVVYRLEDASG